MRELYIEIVKLIIARAEKRNEEFRVAAGEFVMCLGDEHGPLIDQDLIDFFAEFSLFLIFGYNPKRTNNADAIRDWNDCKQRVTALERSSPQT